MHALIAMFTARPYVVAFFLAFAVLATCERGPLRALVWLISGTFLGWLSEFCSVNTGVPFGHYVYHAEQFAGELWLGPVPLFASISFAFMSYFAYSAARRLRASWQRSGGIDVRTPDVSEQDATLGTLALAAVIGMWMDTVIDPLTLLGHYWFLGDLYHYDPPGPHFGVPLVNYVGWVITIGAIVAANQQIDRALHRAGAPIARGPVLPLEPLWGIACCLGVFTFMLIINVRMFFSRTVPTETPLGAVFISGVISTSAFVAFNALMIRRGMVAWRIHESAIPVRAGTDWSELEGAAPSAPPVSRKS